jgi:spermidine synthase
VIDACREHLPSLSAGAFDDPRLQVHIADAFPFVQAEHEPYDLIVLDSTDTYEEESGEISEMLFTRGFYQDCLRLLSADGMAVTQADNLVFCPYSLAAIRAEYAAVFPRVGSYQAIVPAFGGFSGYCWASRGAGPAPSMPPTDLHLRYLNPATWSYAFVDHGFTLALPA